MSDRELARHARWVAGVGVVGAAILMSGCAQMSARVGHAVPSPLLQAEIARQIAPAPDPEPLVNPFDLDKPELEQYVATFQTKSRGFFDRALTRGSRYVLSMSDILVREGLPAELAYLPLIESGYQPHAVSRAGATGPWQFIRATGQRYGLRIDALVDERRDPIKSTEAAVRYLKDLHGMFGDWELSLAAYNVGEMRVAKIIERKGVDDFWSMRRFGYLPHETSDYVPRFLAAVRIAQAPEDYGFDAPIHTELHYETVRVDRDLPLRKAAVLSGVTHAELTALNPALRRDVSPRGYALRVPLGSAAPLRKALARYAAYGTGTTTVARRQPASHTRVAATHRTGPDSDRNARVAREGRSSTDRAAGAHVAGDDLAASGTRHVPGARRPSDAGSEGTLIPAAANAPAPRRARQKI